MNGPEHVGDRRRLPRPALRLADGCDTNLLVTVVWSEHYWGSCPESVRRMAAERTYDPYLLTSPDVPWVGDGLRDAPHARAWFHERFLRELQQHHLPYVVLAGSFEQRLATAIAAVGQLIR